MSARRNLLEELSRAEIARRAPGAIAIVPIGACEQHGPHLPIGTDSMVIQHIAQTVAARLEDRVDVIVAPTIVVGYSPHHVEIGATLTAELTTLFAQLAEICRGLVASGFTKVFILNGHGGNAELVAVAAREAGHVLKVKVGAGSYWTMAWDDLESFGAQDHGRVPGHAGAFETSLMAAVRPDLEIEFLVRDAPYKRNPPGYFGPFHTQDPNSWDGTDGFSDNPARGSRELGEQFLELIATGVARGITQFVGLSLD